jgi:glycosyltransferase involved in cell wall biosynthesis
MNEINVSVIVTTKNEEDHIGDCLRAIEIQNYPQDKIEIIVVDNNSSDRTKEIAFRFTPLVFDQGPERSAQRNFGIEKARGKYLLYLDADMTLSEEVVTECVKKCDYDNLDALYIPEIIVGNGFWIQVRNFEREFYNSTCIDAVRFLRAKLTREIGGFDEDLNGPEDWDFNRRIGDSGKVGIIRNPLYHNEGEFNLKIYLRKKSYYSRGFDQYINKWGKRDKIIHKQFGFWYRYVGVFIENGNSKRLFLHPVLATGMYVLRLLVGLNYLFNTKDNLILREKI